MHRLTFGQSVLRVQSLGLFIGLFLLAIADSTAAQVIDFETTPAGLTPVDDAALPITSDYALGAVQVRFGFDSDSDGTVDAPAKFELAGSPQSEPEIGFVGSNGNDTADAGFAAQLGNWFLRGGTWRPFGKFVIKYTTGLTVTAASGEIWDIDGSNDPLIGTEQYRVQAFDSSNLLLDTIDSPVGTAGTATASLDGQPWTFNFSGLSGSIDHIEVTFIGSKTAGIGLAFNNFYPITVAPEPGTLMPGIVGMMSILGLRRRRV